MSVVLSEKDRAMLDGKYGEAARLAMSILVRMAEVYGATEMMDVTQAHIDGCGLMSESGLEFAETLAAHGGRVSIPTTLNMIPLDLQNWRQFGIPEDFAAKAIRLAKAYTDMGCIPTWTCAPYQGYLTPRFGQQIAWAESNAIVYANSVLGARTNRYGDYMDICAAITGRVPKYGLHLKHNRKGQILLRLVDIEPAVLQDDTFYPALGHLIGTLAQDKIPVIEGLPPGATSDQLKALGAAAASSGAVALFHAIGVTPEASTLEEAFQGDAPERVIDIHSSDLLAARADLSTAEEGARLDWVVLGCPHFSFTEFERLAELIRAHKGRSVHPNVKFLIISNQVAYSLLQRSDLMDVLMDFGVRITLDTCVFHTPIIPSDAKVLMTNSGKCAYYAPGELGLQVAFGSMADCVRSAVEGYVCRGRA
ncbi:MAG: aconitase X catalytic domain-containing protein [Chloroflexi bacterium]|nr:aconitase X catalytic domain-containing protein [Chloroflexota bacterium]